MAIEPITGFYVHDEETDTDGVAKVSIDAVHEFVEDVSGAVDTWLDEHPEATTTVQDDSLTTAKYKDGSVTEDKLAPASVVEGKVNVNFLKEIKNAYVTPDQFNGASDTEKVQAAFDSIINGGNIVIDRIYNIESTIVIRTPLKGLNSSGANKRNFVTGLGNNAGFNITSSVGFQGGAADVGGIYFSNVRFYGDNSNVLFNVANTYHLYFVQCIFENATAAFQAVAGHVQNIYCTQCYFMRVTYGLYTSKGLWAVDFIDCMFESGDTFIVTDANQEGGEIIARNMNVRGCIIEDCNNIGMKLYGYMYAVSVIGCYFEDNTNYDIEIDKGPVRVESCYFEGVSGTGRIKIPATTGTNIPVITARNNRVVVGNLIDNSNATLQFVDVDYMGGHALMALNENTKNINANAQRFISETQGYKATTASTLEYSGKSITIPSYSYYNITVRVRPDSDRVLGVALCTSSTSSYSTALATAENTSVTGVTSVTLTGYTGANEQELHVWVKYSGTGTNVIIINGYYSNKLLPTYLD